MYIDVINYNSGYISLSFVTAILYLFFPPGETVLLQKAKEHMVRKQPLGSLQCANDTPEGETKMLLWH